MNDHLASTSPPTSKPIGQPSYFMIWWKTIRPATLWAGASPVLVGAGIGVHSQIQWGKQQFLTLFLALIGALLIQIACNLVNDYSDFEKGTDDENRLGPARAAAQGWLSSSQLKKGAVLSLSLATLCGVYLTWVGGWPILALGLASLLSAVAYTAGPFPLAYLGLGDLFVLLFFGFGAVGGTAWLLCAESLPSETWVAGAAVGALATAILVVNNLRDRHGDAQNQKNTLAVRFGASFARWEYTVLVFGALTANLYVAWLIESWAWLCPLLLLPLAWRRVRQIWLLDGRDLNPLLGQTAQLELLYCFSLTSGLLLESWLN